MNKYFTTLTNERGDVLPNYRSQVVDNTGAIVTIYEDKSGTRFTDASGNIINYATAEANGRVSFYFDAAEGQVLQTLDAAGGLVDSEPDFADNFVLENLGGSIPQSSVTDLTTDLAAKADAAEVVGLDILASPTSGEGVDLVAGAGKIVTSRTDLKAITGAGDLARPVYLDEGGRSGLFIWDASITIATHQADTLEGLYVAPNAAANGAWVRQWNGAAFAEWFGAVPDWDSGTLTGTDNAPAINACLVRCGNCCLQTGNYGIASPVTPGQLKHLWAAVGVAGAVINPLATFTGEALVRIEATRASVTRITASVPTSFYDPSTGVGTSVHCFMTTGNFFHQYFSDCRAFGGNRGFYVDAKEGKYHRCHADSNFDSFYVTDYDNSFFNCSSTQAVNYGVYTDSGIEINDMHIVRPGERAFFAENQIPVIVNNLFIDTPRRWGVFLNGVQGGVFNGVYFTKMGEYRTFDGGTVINGGGTGPGTTPDWNCYYFHLINCRNNKFVGGAITFQNSTSNISQSGIYFLRDTSAANDSTRAINNTFENFRTSTLPIAENTSIYAIAASQRWINNAGTASKLNNEGLLYRSDEQTIAAAGVHSAKMWLPEINTAAAARRAVLEGNFVAAENATPANFSEGTFVINIAPAGNTGTVTARTTGGTPPTFTITNVAYNTTTRVLTFDVTNTGAGAVAMTYSVKPPLDNQGLS